MWKKRGQVFEMIPPWVIVVVVIVITGIFYGVLSGKLGDLGEGILNFLRFG